MGNQLTSQVKIGTIGELLVQLRLLEYGVQSAPPLKDSGNDLIAIKGESVKFLQVKTSLSNRSRKDNLPKVYHYVVFVKLLQREDGRFNLNESEIKICAKGENASSAEKLSQEIVDKIWSN
jgi:hypothetical protein